MNVQASLEELFDRVNRLRTFAIKTTLSLLGLVVVLGAITFELRDRVISLEEKITQLENK
jgi:hypothetical protein